MASDRTKATVDDRSIVEGCTLGDGVEVAEFSVLHDSEIGDNTQVWRFANIYGADIGRDCMIGTFVEIQSDVKIGDRSRVQSHAFICSLVNIASDVFVSHGAMFVNDLYPPSGNPEEWESTVVREGASIGTNSTVLPVKIGENAIVGAGSVVIDDVPPNAVVAGNPAEIIRYRDGD